MRQGISCFFILKRYRRKILGENDRVLQRISIATVRRRSNYGCNQTEKKDGLLFDPWLRVHVRKNAKIISACKKAVEIRGTVKDWEAWTHMKFPQSGGEYVVEGALCPVVIDTENNLGTYIEPNVWLSYGKL